MGRGYDLESFDYNGQRIYCAAQSSSGESISYSGGIQMMHSIACVNCHGKDGYGGKVTIMMDGPNGPNLAWDSLTQHGEHDEDEEETHGNAHEEHPPYTEQTLRKAITEGIDPAGESLG